MPEEKSQINIYEKMTPNEEVYYSFLKNLQYVFSELGKAEEEYANNLTRLLYFLNINAEDNDKFPALELRKKLANHLEKSRDIHLELSKNCGEKLFAPIKKLISEGLKNKAEFEFENVRNDQLFEELKLKNEKLKKQYYDQVKLTTKAFRDDLHKKYKQKYALSEYDDIRKKNECNKQKSIELQQQWEKQISKCSQERVLYINRKKEEIKKYKNNNKAHLVTLNAILSDYFNIYHTFYSNAKEIFESTKTGNEKKEFASVFYDISDWVEAPKFDFVPFISGNEQFFTSPEILPEKKRYTVDFMNIIRNYLEDFCQYQAPELFDSDLTNRDNFKKIQEIANCIIQKRPKDINKDSLQLMYTKTEYILFYLRVLNQNRAKLVSLSKDVYDAIKNTMIDILNKCNEVDLQNVEIEQYYEILQVIIALSQAFSLETNGDNVLMESTKLLQEDLNQHPLWKKPGFWLEIINFNIENEKQKQRVNEERYLSQREQKIKSIAHTTITTYVFTMSSLLMSKDVIGTMRKECCEKFKIDVMTVPEYIAPEVDTRKTFNPNADYRDSTASNF